MLFQFDANMWRMLHDVLSLFMEDFFAQMENLRQAENFIRNINKYNE